MNWTFTSKATLPVGTLYGIGRNYAAHAREMGAAVPDDPIVFIKPPSSYAPDGSIVTLPAWSDNVHHEIELVVVIGIDAEDLSVDDAHKVIAGYGIGLDLTARDVQSVAKQRGEPWAVAKGWKGSAPVSHIVPANVAGPGPWTIALDVNGERRQHVSTATMERTIPEMISYLSRIFTLRMGDAIFTGTPEGVAQVRRGDLAVATLDDLTTLRISFA